MNRPIEKEYVLGKIYGLADDIKDTPTIEPCEDAISRAWVKENMLKYGFLAPDMTVTEFVEDAPLVAPSRPSGEWIPCIERLPEVNGESYLTYQGSAKHGFCQVLYYDDGWNCYHGDKENEINGVVAWMPLPEPWKGADNEL